MRAVDSHVVVHRAWATLDRIVCLCDISPVFACPMCALVLVRIVRLFVCSACACVRGHVLTCPKSSVCSFSQPVLAFVCTFVYALCLY